MNIEKYLNEREEILVKDLGALEVIKENTEMLGPVCDCGGLTLLIKRVVYQGKTELGRVCDAAYCIDCNNAKFYLGDEN